MPISWDTIAQLGAAGAVIAVVVMFLRHLATKDAAFNEIMTNHLDHSTEAERATAESREKLAAVLGELKEHCQQVQSMKGN